jgi:hypothetical protein
MEAVLFSVDCCTYSPYFITMSHRASLIRVANCSCFIFNYYSSSVVACVSITAVACFYCRGNVFYRPLPSNGRLFLLNYSGF